MTFIVPRHLPASPPGSAHGAGLHSADQAHQRVFRGISADEDLGLELATKKPSDRYAFRTSPIRNVSVQPTFGHNDACTRLPDMIRHPSMRSP